MAISDDLKFRIGEAGKMVAQGRYIDYVLDTAIYTQDIQIESLCNSMVFMNTGTMTVMVKNIKIVPGASFGVTGNYGEFDVTVYDIAFPDIVANQDAGLLAELTVIRKVYSNNPGALFQMLGPQAAYKL